MMLMMQMHLITNMGCYTIPEIGKLLYDDRSHLFSDFEVSFSPSALRGELQKTVKKDTSVYKKT
jgi:hypothetical protein